MSELLGNLKGKVISDVSVKHFDSDKGSIKTVMIGFTDGASLTLRGKIESQGDPHETATYVVALMLEQLGSTSFVEKDELTPHIQTDIFLKGSGSNC